MLILAVGSTIVKKGVEYAGIIHKGNAVYAPKGTRISINRKPFSTFVDEVLLIHPDFTYAFEEDTVLSLYYAVNSEGERIFEASCPTTVDLVDGVESAAICTLTMTADLTAGKGTMSAAAYIDNTSTSNRDIIVRMQVDGVDIANNTVRVLKKSMKAVSISIEAQTVSDGSDITFTLEANGNKCEVIGAIYPSIIKIEKTL